MVHKCVSLNCLVQQIKPVQISLIAATHECKHDGTLQEVDVLVYKPAVNDSFERDAAVNSDLSTNTVMSP